MTTDVTVLGEDHLASTMSHLAHELEDMTPANDKAAHELLDRATPHTPRDSGALAASGRVVTDTAGSEVVYDEVYAGVIHNGWPDHNIDAQPWLADTATQDRDDLVGVYIDYVTDLVHQVHGL